MHGFNNRPGAMVWMPVACKTKEGGFDIIYGRPSQVFPEKDDVEEIIKGMVYLMSRVIEREKNSTEGVAVVINMQSWDWENYGTKYATKFFELMKGRFPIRIRCFYMVEPPSMFDKVWKLIKPMMGDDFAQKVKIIKNKEELKDHVNDISHMPDSVGGDANIDNIIAEFIKWRKGEEGV